MSLRVRRRRPRFVALRPGPCSAPCGLPRRGAAGSKFPFSAGGAPVLGATTSRPLRGSQSPTLSLSPLYAFFSLFAASCAAVRRRPGDRLLAGFARRRRAAAAQGAALLFCPESLRVHSSGEQRRRGSSVSPTRSGWPRVGTSCKRRRAENSCFVRAVSYGIRGRCMDAVAPSVSDAAVRKA